MKTFTCILKRNTHAKSPADPDYYGMADFEGRRISIVGNRKYHPTNPMLLLRFHEKNRDLAGQGFLQRIGNSCSGEADIDGNRIAIAVTQATDEHGVKHLALRLTNYGEGPEAFESDIEEHVP